MVTIKDVYTFAKSQKTEMTLSVRGYKPLSTLLALRTTIASHCKIWKHEELLLNTSKIDDDILNMDLLRGLMKAGLVYMEEDKLRTTIEEDLETLSSYDTETVMLIAANELLGIGVNHPPVIKKAAIVVKDNLCPIFSIEGLINALSFFNYHDDNTFTDYFKSVAYTKEEMLAMFEPIVKDVRTLPTPSIWLECITPSLAIDAIMEYHNLQEDYGRAEEYRSYVHDLSHGNLEAEPKHSVHAVCMKQHRTHIDLKDYLVDSIQNLPLLVVHPAQCIRDITSKRKVIFNRARRHGVSSFLLLSQIHYYTVIHSKKNPVTIDNTLMETWGDLYGDIVSIENALLDAIELIKVE